MMNFKILILLLLLQNLAFGQQIAMDKTSYDFGDIYAHSERFVDFYFQNNGASNAYILRVEKSKNAVYELSSSSIAANQSSVLRLQVSIKQKGNFKIVVPVYLSDRNEPIDLVLTGHIKEVAPNNTTLTDCPNFSSRPSDGNPMDFMLTVVTIDKQSKQLLERSKIEIIQSGLPIAQWKTNKDGKAQGKIPLGFTYFYAAHENYLPTEMGAYVNFKRNYIVIELERTLAPKISEPETVVHIVSPPIVVTNPVESSETALGERPVKPAPIEIEWPIEKPEQPEKSKNPKINEQEVVEIPVSKPNATQTSDLESIPKDNFSPLYFVPNNLVFVLDVSHSMSKEDRLELMKVSLIQLMEYVRPEDKITIVSYGNSAKVIVPTTSGTNKENIIQSVSKLSAAGMTAGGQGIRAAYSILSKEEIVGGNNQIIVITDGAFNKDSQDYEGTIKRLAKRGHILSVVGIKIAPLDEEKMTQVAKLGNGRLIGIESLSDARFKLIEEIRIASFVSPRN